MKCYEDYKNIVKNRLHNINNAVNRGKEWQVKLKSKFKLMKLKNTF